MTGLTLFLYTGIFLLLRREHDFAAGIVLGCLVYKPQLVIALGVMLLVKWRWRVLLGGLVSAGLWLWAGFALSPAAMREYIRISPWLFDLLRSGVDSRWSLAASYPTWRIHSLYGFSVLLLDGVWKTAADGLAILLTIGGLGVVAFAWRRAAWRPGARAWDLTLAGTAALGLLISPHLSLYDLMLLLLPFAIVWSYYPHGANGRPLDGGPLLAWTAALYVIAFVGSYLSAAQLWLSGALGLPKFAVQVSTLIIAGWVWVVMRLAQDPSLTEPEPHTKSTSSPTAMRFKKSGEVSRT